MLLLLKLSFRPWRLAPLSQLCSALAVGFLLVMAGFLFWIQQGLRPVLNRLHREQVITAYLLPTVDRAGEQKVIDEIRVSLGSHAGDHADIHWVSTDRFLAEIGKVYPDLAKAVEDLGDEAPLVVPRYVAVSGVFQDTALESVRAVNGIESAETSRDRYKSALGAFSALRWVARILVLGLGLALLTGLIHLARTNAYIHREVISLIRLMGGSGAWLQAPGVLSGLSVGLLGGVLAAGAWMSAGVWLGRHVKSLSPLLREIPSIRPSFSLFLLLTGAVIGLVAGAAGSVASRSSSGPDTHAR